MPPRRLLLTGALSTAALSTAALTTAALSTAALFTAALAQSWPTRPLRMVVAFPAGGSTDAVIRLIAPSIERALGQPLLIENRPGANGALGAAAVAQAVPDGYTWLADSGGFASNLFLMRGLGFDYVSGFALVTQLSVLPAVLVVRAGGPHDTLDKLLAHLRANPGRESYGSSGIGNLTHLSAAILMRRAGVRAEHVPYRGSPQQMAAMLSGDTLFSFSTLPAAGPLIRGGQLLAIAASSAAPVPGFEAVLPLAAQGFPGFDLVEFHQISAPAGTPAPMVGRMAEAAAAAMADPALAGRFQQLGLVPRAEGPAAFARFLADQRVRLAEVIRAEGIGLD